MKGYFCAQIIQMEAEKLKSKYDRSSNQVLYQDNDPMNDEKYQEFMKENNKFSDALTALHQNYCPSQINARDEEMRTIREYLEAGIASKGCSESMYVSGVPGIGKTLCVKKVAQQVCNEKKASFIYTNALNIKKPFDIFKAIHYQMTKKKLEAHHALYELDNYFQKQIKLLGFQEHKDQVKVLILDEIDFLKSNDQEVLYNIFEWTQKKKSKLVIISISNTLDFPETLNGKVASRMGKKSISFKPYSSQQIERILLERIGKADVFHEQALSYICKKIAQCSSDIRKCLFILRESIAQFLIQNDTKAIGKKKIPVDTLAKTHQKIYSDSLTQSFHEFPSAYKIVLYCLAKYYRNQTHMCTMRQLESFLGTFIKSRNQLIPILMDLKDLGIVKFTYNYFRSADTNTMTSFKFQNLKEVKEEHIKLLIEYDRILHALQKENLKEIKFNISLAF